MADSDNESGGHNINNESITKEQDRFLPIANVSRIMKKALPANAKISKDAKETVQECVSEFISFITGEASDKCQREKRKTINGDDLLWAMTTLGFEDYVEPLKERLPISDRGSTVTGHLRGDSLVMQCHCGMSLPLKTVGTADNEGIRFYSCLTHG
ncbi:hypothetical protein ACFE04_029151 [Oxalis oulophora]